jgi:hypothetical protein
METREKHEVAKYWGTYRGFVRDIKDPKQLGRVKCQVPSVLGNELLTDWAFPTGAVYGGAKDSGDFRVPVLGAAVYVRFEEGEVNRPIYEAIWWGEGGGESHVPKLARGVKDETTQSPKGDDFFVSGDGSEHLQPKTPFAAQYPHNQVLKTANEKIVREVDDTPGKGRIHDYHGPSKSWDEVGPDGTRSVRVAARRYTEVGQADETHVKGSRHAEVVGDDALRVDGNQTIRVFGDRTTFIFGNDVEFVLGAKITTVVLAYARIAGIAISDLAPVVSHNP